MGTKLANAAASTASTGCARQRSNPPRLRIICPVKRWADSTASQSDQIDRSGIQHEVAEGLRLSEGMTVGQLKVDRIGHLVGRGEQPTAMAVVGEVVS